MPIEEEMIVHINNEEIFNKMELVIDKTLFTKPNPNDTDVLLCGVIALLLDINVKLQKLIEDK